MALGERRLAAIMFTDIVGYTRLAQTNESLALELLNEHRVILRSAFVGGGGVEVKTIGDAFLVEFKSALDAVLCAVDLQKKMLERNERMGPSRKIELRIGIHVGDVVHEGGDLYGDAVNVASRIEPVAEPGGICISQQVFDQVSNKTTLSIEKIGDVELKNVQLPVSVYRVNWNGERLASEEREGPRERIGVLPFVNISPDPNDEYFSDGLTEELITKLSEIRDLKIIARTSVMSYKHKDKKVAEIARELGVGSLIEGSVRKSGNKIRITVQLVDAHTEEHLWSSNYESQLGDIFEIQSDVASKVAAALSARFSKAAAHKDTKDMEAYTLYLKAMQTSYETTEASMRETVSLLQRAIAKDPKFARAYAGLADALHALGITGYEDFSAMAKRSEAAAMRALELDPGLAEAHSAMAGVHYMLDRFDQALVEAEAAVRLNPNLSDAYISLGVLDMITRTPEDALPMFRRAYELDPLSPGACDMLITTATWVGKDAEALEVLNRMRELNPNEPKVYLGIADYCMEKKDFEEAQKMVDVARGLGPAEPMVVPTQGILFALTGKRKEAEETLKEVLMSANESLRLAGALWINSALGNIDEALKVLMQQAENHSWPFNIRADPLYAELRKSPGFIEFCEKVGIKS